MKRRNGAGSRQLVDVTDRFRRGQLRLIKVLEENALVTPKEAAALAGQLARATAQKRSSDVFEAALTISNRLQRALRREGAGDRGRQDSDFEILFEVSRMAQSSLQPEEVYNRLLDLVQQAVPFENATLFLWNTQERRVVPVLQRGRHIDLIGGVSFEHGTGFSAWVAKQKKPVLLTELHRGLRPDDTTVGCFLAVPLVVQGELVGVLNLSHPQPKAFTEDHLRLLLLIAGQAAATIQRLQLYAEMRQMAITDDLTGLYNRRHFLERLQSELDRARRYQVPFGLLFLDIDNFKELNDSFGHQVGDRILAELGAVLKSWARSSDIVGRYGGEEFIILLPMTERSRAMLAAERLRTKIEQHLFYRRKKLTVSVGVAGFAEDGDTAEQLLGRVDEALYMAKKTGRNRSCAFRESLVLSEMAP